MLGGGVEMCGVEIVMQNGTAGDGVRIREAQSVSEVSARVLSCYYYYYYYYY